MATVDIHPGLAALIVVLVCAIVWRLVDRGQS